MNKGFPPVTTREGEIDELLNILGSVIVERSGVYVSVPITSGRRYGEWLNSRNLEADLSHPETYQEFQREVLKPNFEHAQTIVKKLRELFPKALIDPTALKDIESWTQDDYRYLWGKVIEQHAGTVVFIDGWQYSNGCSYEFLVSYQSSNHHCPLVLDENLKPLTLEKGLMLMRAAIIEMREAGLSTEFLERVAERLASTVLGGICARP
jgi:hypothetical protein